MNNNVIPIVRRNVATNMKASFVFQILDHIGIYLVIAGESLAEKKHRIHNTQSSFFPEFRLVHSLSTNHTARVPRRARYVDYDLARSHWRLCVLR